MKHADAVETNLAERYLLGELSDSEAEAFEEHYFDCRVCASDVRDGSRLLDTGRELVRKEAHRDVAPVVPIRRGVASRSWLQAAAAIVVIAGATTVAMIATRDAAPSIEVARPLSLLMSESRGASPNDVTLRPGEPLVIYVDIPADPPFPRYELRVRDAQANDVTSTRVSAEQARDTLNLLLRDLRPGTYNVVVEGLDGGGGRTHLASDQFTVHREASDPQSSD